MKGEMKTMKVAIVIPIYRPFAELLENEVAALIQIKAVLYARDIFYVHPSYLDTTDYLTILEPLNVNTIKVDNSYFGNLERNNELFISHSLYRHFSQYDYMLIHHTDAYVFSDQLDYWCSQDLDYTGAPWFEGNKEPFYPLTFKGVGNGGFSLRKVSSFLKITSNRPFMNYYVLLFNLHKFLEGNHYLFLRKYLGINFIMNVLRTQTGYEDEFWGMVVPKYYKWFKVAQPEFAIKFSFEVMPRLLFELNNNELPFGCHASDKYDPEFWESFMQSHKNIYDNWMNRLESGTNSC